MTCPQCQGLVPEGAFFCPHCGKELAAPPLSTSGFTQLWIYALSVLAPPLGLWPGVKYVRRATPEEKQIGWIAIVLTVLSTVITLWLTFALLGSYVNTINQSFGGTL